MTGARRALATAALAAAGACSAAGTIDPIPACVAAGADCGAGDVCPSGLSCAPLPPDGSAAEPQPVPGTCRVADFDRLTLQDRFDVDAMRIAIDPDASPPVVSWDAPAAARVVACALFTCNPAYASIGESPTGRRELFRIVNLGECALLFGVLSATQTFWLADDHALGEAPRCTAGDPGERVLGRLAVGCWAYDDTRIVAATDLVRVRGSLVRGLRALRGHLDECPADGDGAPCYEAVDDRFGVCARGACRARCATSLDCPPPADAPAGEPAAAPLACAPVPGHALGACVPPP